MKILHVISQRPDSTGSGIYLQQIITRAARAGHENFLVCGLGADDTVNLDGLEIHNRISVKFQTPMNPGLIVGMSDVMPYPSRTFRSLDAAALKQYREHFRNALISAAKRFTPDIIHSHHLWLVTALITETLPGIPTATSCHGSDLRQFSQCPHLQNIVSTACSKIDTICALSGHQKKLICSIFQMKPDRIAITGAGFDKTLFHPDTSTHKATDRPLQILYAGKLSRAKGVVWLLKALSRLRQFPFHLHLAGSGHGIEYEQCFQEATHIQNRVSFHGSLPQHALAELMRQTDLLLLPSLFEGLPLVILEALACGCRVIATDLPGMQEIAYHVDHEFLTLVHTPNVTDIDTTTLDDEKRFVTDLQTALLPYLDGTKHFSRKQPALDYFTWESVYSRIQAIWNKLIQTRTS